MVLKRRTEELSKRKQIIDDLIELVVELPDDTIDEILAIEEEFTIDEAVEEVVRIAKECGEYVKEG